MAWQPATYYNLKLETPIASNVMVMTGPQLALGELQSAGVGGITVGLSSLAVPAYLPPVGNPHVANHVYIDGTTGLWLVSTG